jgi:hypothetical protein
MPSDSSLLEGVQQECARSPLSPIITNPSQDRTSIADSSRCLIMSPKPSKRRDRVPPECNTSIVEAGLTHEQVAAAASFAWGSEPGVSTTFQTTPFTTRLTLRQHMSTIDNRLPDLFESKILAVRAAPRCQWTEDQVRSMVKTILDGDEFSVVDDPKIRYQRPTYTKLEELTLASLPAIGRMVMIHGEPRVLQRIYTKCSRKVCTAASTAFEPGQKPALVPGGWTHSAVGDTLVPPEPVAKIPDTCSGCARSFLNHPSLGSSLQDELLKQSWDNPTLIVPTVEGSDPIRLAFLPGGGATTCRQLWKDAERARATQVPESVGADAGILTQEEGCSVTVDGAEGT